MRYEPVKIRHIFAVEYKRRTSGAKPKPTPQVPGAPATARGGEFYATGRVKEYWQVYSKMFGECGHKHKTEAGAKRCKRKMQARWTAFRSKQMRRIYRAGIAKRKQKYVVQVKHRVLTSPFADREIL